MRDLDTGRDQGRGDSGLCQAPGSPATLPVPVRAHAPAERAAWIGALRAEQRERWQAGGRIFVEQFLDLHPRLASDPEALVDLLIHEMELRKEFGDGPDRAEYCSRFPHVAARVEQRLNPSSPRPLEPLSTCREPPMRIGPASAGPAWPSIPGFEILVELARGGMGVVYLARQPRLNRLVALKTVALSEAANPEVLARFKAEAEAVAQLHHPNIVQIFEVGETRAASGLPQPFMALEYVEGGTLADRVRGTPQPPRDCALVLSAIARAIDHAHARGIIHRDLKPSNVLLSAGGVRSPGREEQPVRDLGELTPKVTDFGIAKHLAGNTPVTRTGVAMGTPAYMAPEQATADCHRVGPPADIYALGVILYELLTGRLPFEAVSDYHTLLQLVEQDPIPPHRLRPGVPRDLETICLKCLRKEPARRYATAADLAADLDRYLSDRPILARPIGPVERAWRWCRRNPLVASLLLLIHLLVFGSLVSLATLWIRAEEQRAEADVNATAASVEKNNAIAERQRAEHSYRLARQALEQLALLRQDPRLQQGPMEDLRRKLAEAEVQFYERFLEQRSDDKSFQIDRGHAYFGLGAVADQLHSRDKALEYYGQAVAVFTALDETYPNDPAILRPLAQSHGHVGSCLARSNQFVEALAAFRTAKHLGQRVLDINPDNTAAHLEVARSFQNLATVHHAQGQWHEAEETLLRAEGILQELGVRGVPEPEYRHGLAHVHYNLGYILARAPATDRRAEAESRFLRARDLFQTHFAGQPPQTHGHHDVALCENELGSFYRSRGQLAEAGQRYEAAIQLLEPLSEAHPLQLSYAVAYAGAACNRAHVHRDLGQRNEALPFYDRAVATLQFALARDPDFGSCRLYLRNAHWGRAVTRTRLGLHSPALDDWEQAVAMDERSADGSRLSVGWAQSAARLGRYEAAMAEAIEIARRDHAGASLGVELMRTAAHALLALDRDTGPESAHRQALSSEYQRFALHLLQRLLAAGSPSDASHLIQNLQADPDFAALRETPEFRKALNRAN